MTSRSNISHYFESILGSIKNMEHGSQVFEQLNAISGEVAQLEKFVKSSFNSLDNHFQAFVKQLNLLSDLIEFQRKVIHFRTPEEMTRAVFSYIKNHIAFDHAFIYLKIDAQAEKGNLIIPDRENLDLYQRFLFDGQTLANLQSFAGKKDLALLLNDLDQLPGRHVPWEQFGARSAILFPLKMQGQFLGFGALITQHQELELGHLSFVNLILGLLSLLLFQHFYFFQLKRRLFKQVKLQKVLEEVKYAEYFDKGPLFIYSLDRRGVILHANAAALGGVRLSKENVIGEKFLDFLPMEHRKPFENILNQLQIGDLQFYKCPVQGREEVVPIWEFYLTKMELHDRFHLNIIFAVDVTRQHYREKRRQRNEVLDQINQFSRIMNGYLNSLLTVMVPNVSLLKTHLPGDHPLQKYLGTMEKSLNQTNSLVRKFLNYSLAEIEQPRQANLNNLIRKVVERLQTNMKGDIEFTFALDPAIPSMRLYSKRIAQLLGILVQNSLEAIRQRGHVRLSTRIVNMTRDDSLPPHMFFLNKGRYIELCVEDDGCGIDPEIEKHIFKPFFSTKIKNEGLGLGLFVAYNIVHDLDGEIFLRNVKGEKTTFFVYLPINGKTVVGTVKPATPTSTGSKKPLILVVDDEYHIRSMLIEVFELNGFQVYSAANGKEAVDLFEKHQREIDLVILDMVMPVMDGRKAFEEIRKRKQDQKVIIISGYADREDLQEILSSGALAYMSKPFQVNEIVKKVQSVLAIN